MIVVKTQPRQEPNGLSDIFEELVEGLEAGVAHFRGERPLKTHTRSRRLSPYESLRTLGIDQRYIKQTLGGGASTEDQLGFLWQVFAPPATGYEVAYKRSVNVAVEEVERAATIALALGRLIAKAYTPPQVPLPESILALRRLLLERGGMVDFASLLDWCWSAGIVVFPLVHFPAGARKMTALVTKISGCPVICLSYNTNRQARQAFWLGHELSHLLRRHLEGREAVVDTEDAGSGDPQEQEANADAVALLTGSSESQFTPSSLDRRDAAALAHWARCESLRHSVDAEVIVCNFWRHHTEYAPLVESALKILEPTPGALRLVRERLALHLERSVFSPDEVFLLKNLAVFPDTV